MAGFMRHNRKGSVRYPHVYCVAPEEHGFSAGWGGYLADVVFLSRRSDESFFFYHHVLILKSMGRVLDFVW